MLEQKLPVFPVSLYLILIGILLIILAVTNGIFIWFEVPKLQNDAKLINELGIIRGSIQRVIKLEIAGTPSDKLIREIDNVINHFIGSKVIFQEDTPKLDFIRRLEILEKQWQQMKETILMYRTIPSKNNRRALIQRSEMCWDITNDAVFKAQLFSETRVRNLYNVFIIIGADIIILLFVLWLVKNFVKNSLEKLAHYDFLTKLLNRYSYNKIIETEITRSQRYRRPLSLILIDIDHFKQINDTYGHKVGDQILQQLAEIFRETVRKNDHISRIGGEEFAIITPETPLPNAERLSERLRQEVQNYRFPVVKTVTISLGVTEFHQPDSQDTFFKRADHALYQAKESGRNRVVEG